MNISNFSLDSNETELQDGSMVIKKEAMSILLVLVDHFLAFMSLASLQTIVDYIKTKPLGQQTSVDSLNIAFLRLLQVINIIFLIFIVILDCTKDSGDILAKIMMWPFFNSMDFFFVFLNYITIIHQIIIVFPHLIEYDFTKLFKVLVILTIACVVAIDVFCHLKGMFPPTYYTIRQLPVENTRSPIIIIREVTIFSSVFVQFLVRAWFCCLNIQDGEAGSKVIGDKSMIAVILLIASSVVAVRVYGWHGKPMRVAATIVLNIWPHFIAMTNKQLKTFTLRRITSWKTTQAAIKAYNRTLEGVNQVLLLMLRPRRLNVVDVEVEMNEM